MKTPAVWILTVCALTLTSFAAEKPAATASKETVNLKLATILPVGTSGEQQLQEMRSNWSARSGKSVNLTIYAGSGDGEAQIVKKMRSGQIHAALMTVVGLSEIDKSVTALQLIPLTFRDWREVDYVREKVREDLETGLRKQGFEVLFWADAGWVRFFSKGPALRPADLKPMKMFVWSGEPKQLTIMRSLGYQPVSLETEQILPSLSNAMITVVPAPPFLANALQYNRHTKHMLDLNWVPIVGAAIVKREIWETIPAETRAALLKTADETGRKFRTRAREEDGEAIAAMKKRELVVHTVPPEAVAEWDALREQLYPQIRGSIVPTEIFDRVLSEVKAFRATATADAK